MNADTFFEFFDLLGDAPNSVVKLRELILELAIQGKLLRQIESEGETTELWRSLNRVASSRIEPGDANQVSAQLPSSWKLCRLATIAEVLMGNSPPGETYNDKGVGVPLVNGPVEFSEGPFGLTVKTKFTTEPTKLCKKGDLLICVRGSTTGRTNIAAFDACIGRGVAALRAKPIQPWLNLVIWSLRTRIFNKGTGSTFPSVSYDKLADLLISLPPLAEQRRIVSKVDELLGLCDELETRQGARRELRERLVQAALDQLLATRDPADFATHWQRLQTNFDVLFDTPEAIAKLRDVVSFLAVAGRLIAYDGRAGSAVKIVELAKAAKSTSRSVSGGRIREPLATLSDGELPIELPDGWIWTRFDDIADIVGGVTKGRDLAGKTTASFPYLRVANVQRGYLELDLMKEISLPIEELPKYELRPNDLLLTEGGDWDKVGRTAIWRGELATCLHQNHVFRARLAHDGIQPDWIALFTNSLLGRRYFEGCAKQTTNLASINMTQLRHCPIPIPPTSVQLGIVSKVTELLSVCDALEAKLTQAESAGTQLLAAAVQDLLTGDIIVAGTDQPNDRAMRGRGARRTMGG